MLNISLLWSLQSSVTELKYALCLGQNLLALAILKFPYQEKAYSSTSLIGILEDFRCRLLLPIGILDFLDRG